MSGSTWRSKWMDWTPEVSKTAKDGTVKSAKRGFDTFGTPIPSHSEKTLGGIDPSDRSTWPPYLVRLEQISRDHFGPEAATRQVRAELAFLERAEAEGWQLVGTGNDQPKGA